MVLISIRSGVFAPIIYVRRYSRMQWISIVDAGFFMLTATLRLQSRQPARRVLLIFRVSEKGNGVKAWIVNNKGNFTLQASCVRCSAALILWSAVLPKIRNSRNFRPPCIRSSRRTSMYVSALISLPLGRVPKICWMHESHLQLWGNLLKVGGVMSVAAMD